MTTTVLDVIALAWAHLESGWCRDHTAEDDQGNLLSANHPEAVAWCLIGSVDVAYHELLFDLPHGTELRQGIIERLWRHSESQFGERPEIVNDLCGPEAAFALVDALAAEIGKG